MFFKILFKMITKLKAEDCYTIDIISKKLFHNKYGDYRNAFFHNDHLNRYIDDLQDDENNITYLSYDGNKLLGCITYCIDHSSDSVYAMVILSFEGTNLIWGRDIYRSIEDIIVNNNIFKLVFSASSNNPLLKSYKKIVEKYGGREVGVFRKNIFDAEFQKRYDEIFFEIESSAIKEKIKGE